MIWFNEVEANANIFYKTPSSTNRPGRIPASWLAACISFHLESIRLNNFALVEALLPSLDSLRYHEEIPGVGLYPTLSFLNHSCDPNTAVFTVQGGTIFLIATRSIPVGSEVTVSYGDLFFTTARSARRKSLRKHYRFLCMCEACVNNWPRCSGDRIKANFNIDVAGFAQYISNLSDYLKYDRYSLKTLSSEDLQDAKRGYDLVRKVFEPGSKYYHIFDHFFVTHVRLLYGNYTIEPWVKLSEND